MQIVICFYDLFSNRMRISGQLTVQRSEFFSQVQFDVEEHACVSETRIRAIIDSTCASLMIFEHIVRILVRFNEELQCFTFDLT